MIGPTAVIPQYYGVHWGVYPANIIQQQGPGGQPRRPISPSQTSEVTNQSNGNLAAAAAAAGNLQGPLSQYQVLHNLSLCIHVWYVFTMYMDTTLCIQCVQIFTKCFCNTYLSCAINYFPHIMLIPFIYTTCVRVSEWCKQYTCMCMYMMQVCVCEQSLKYKIQ